VVIIPDGSHIDVTSHDWSRFGGDVKFAHLSLPTAEFPYHYRLVAAIALAEISRQVGRPAARAPAAPRPPIYDYSLGKIAEGVGELVALKDLMNF
jgi:hypothetical protein